MVMTKSGFLDANASEEPHIGHTLAEGSVRSRPHFGHLRMNGIHGDYNIEKSREQFTEVMKAGFENLCSRSRY